MATVSERVRRMKENFMSLHGEGKSIKEIAQTFNLSDTTVYHYLGEIASQNGISRESLLQQVHKTPTFWEREQARVHIDVDELNNSFIIADQALSTIITQINDILEEVNANDQEI